jgi:uncharacterized membrane protein YgdD (TMEM256/DUF423 family)
MSRIWLGLSGFLGATGVMAGAFASHWLSTSLGDRPLHLFSTASRYQLIHALALGLVALLLRFSTTAWLKASAWAFAGGTILFSGSLYALALSIAPGLGLLTPLEGLGLIGGWVLLRTVCANNR